MDALPQDESHIQDVVRAVVTPRCKIDDPQKLKVVARRLSDRTFDAHTAMGAIAGIAEQLSVDIDFDIPMTRQQHAALEGIALLAKAGIGPISDAVDFIDKVTANVRNG